MVIAVFVVIIDSRFYFFFSWFIYGALMFLLLLVLLFGNEINGAKSWFEFGNFSLQPSEFAKFGTALALAVYLSAKEARSDKSECHYPCIGNNSASGISDSSPARHGFHDCIFCIVPCSFQGRNESLYICIRFTNGDTFLSDLAYE